MIVIRVHKAVKTIDAAGEPGEKEGNEEEEGDAGVEPGFRVRRVGEGGVAGERAEVEGGRVAVVLERGRADGDVDGVGGEVGEGCFGEGWEGGWGSVVGVRGEGGFATGVGGDVDFGGDGALEGVLVERVEEALQLVLVGPDFAEGHDVDYQGEDKGDPSVRHEVSSGRMCVLGGG